MATRWSPLLFGSGISGKRGPGTASSARWKGAAFHARLVCKPATMSTRLASAPSPSSAQCSSSEGPGFRLPVERFTSAIHPHLHTGCSRHFKTNALRSSAKWGRWGRYPLMETPAEEGQVIPGVPAKSLRSPKARPASPYCLSPPHLCFQNPSRGRERTAPCRPSYLRGSLPSCSLPRTALPDLPSRSVFSSLSSYSPALWHSEQRLLASALPDQAL